MSTPIILQSTFRDQRPLHLHICPRDIQVIDDRDLSSSKPNRSLYHGEYKMNYNFTTQ